MKIHFVNYMIYWLAGEEFGAILIINLSRGSQPVMIELLGGRCHLEPDHQPVAKEMADGEIACD